MKRCGLPKKEYIISDTVGFIRNLPTSLVVAFRATLEEIVFSDLIVHVVDVSDEYADKNAEVVYTTLEELGVDTANENRIIEVHNKIDISEQQTFSPFLKSLTKNKVFSISAEKKRGLEKLYKGIEKNLYKHKVQESIVLDVNETEKLKWLYQKQLVKFSELNENSIKLELSWDSDEKKKFSQSFVETVL